MFHGIKKSDIKKLTPEEEKKNEEKLKKIAVIHKQVLKIKKECKYSAANLDFLLKAGQLMADYPTIWDVRKILIEQYIPTITEDELYEFLKKEITSIQGIMLRNPKCYLLWYHRIWCLIKALEIEKKKGIPMEKCLLMNEIELCNKFAMKDDRNFHCWNYRVAILTLISKYYNETFPQFLQKQLDYSLSMITKNFSNFSAWHYRGKLIPIYFYYNGIQWNTQKALDYFTSDLELLKKAMYTDPKDQSPWNYHYWIINNFSPIYVEKVDIKDSIVTIKYSNVFKIHNIVDIQGEGEILNKEEFSSEISIKIPSELKENITIKSKVLNDINFDFDHLNLITNKICFTKENVSLPTIVLSNKEGKIDYTISMTNVQQFQIDFLKSEEQKIIQLIKDSKDFFVENGHFRLAQLNNIFYQISSVSQDEKEREKAKEYRNKEIEEYKLLKEKSKRMTNMYATLLQALQ